MLVLNAARMTEGYAEVGQGKSCQRVVLFVPPSRLPREQVLLVVAQYEDVVSYSVSQGTQKYKGSIAFWNLDILD